MRVSEPAGDEVGGGGGAFMGIYGDGGLTNSAITLSNVTANSNMAGGGALLVHYPVFRA